MEIVSDWLPELIIAILAPFAVSLIRNIKERLTGRESTPMRPNKPSKENQLGDCKAAQYINKRNLLIFQARQDAKKRLGTLLVNSVSLCIFIVFWFATLLLLLYSILPLAQDIDSLAFISILSIGIKAFIYGILLILLTFLVILQFLLLCYKVPTWPDFRKKFRERKYFKQSVKERCCVPISKVIDVASHFDRYLLLDADSRETFLKDGVIGARDINESESIRKVIKSCLNKKPNKKLVVFIYSRHGKASYEQTKNARDKYKYVYDLGPVCGDMRNLEIVAHQLYYLQDGKCLRLS